MSNSHMFKDMLNRTNESCKTLICSEKNAEELYLKCLALIVVSNMRIFLRDKSELEIYKLLKEVPALVKMKAAEKHQVAGYCLKFL